MNSPVQKNSVLVAVCTFQRNNELLLLLDSLVPAVTGLDVDVLVVDNDPHRGALSVVADHPLRPRYSACAQPGIAQARNASLAFRHGHEFVAFVDDDESVAPNWLAELLQTMADCRADVVAGPVVTRYPANTAKWVVRGGFLQRARHPSGTILDRFATNNALVRVAALDSLETPEFDTAFSRSGGSDTELAWRLHRAGARIVWSDTAEVFEALPDDRLTALKIMRRLMRGGNNIGRLRAREQSRWAVAARGVAVAAYGVLLTLRSLAVGRGFRSADFEYVPHGIGVVSSTFGMITREYARG